ncbi:hypothetical protein MMC11_006199 [Xylographa trunciseda]|nr:hypothetical protein [Xylographa trunciseda]
MDLTQKNENEAPSRTLSTTQTVSIHGASLLKASSVSTSIPIQSESLFRTRTDVLSCQSSIDSTDTVSEEPQQFQDIVTTQDLAHSAVAETGTTNFDLVDCITSKDCTTVLSQDSSEPSYIKIRDFAHEPRLNPPQQVRVPLLHISNDLHTASPEAPQAISEAPITPRKPSLRSIASSSSLHLTRRLSNISISSSRSTPQPPRLPRYLGNHKPPTVSTLGRSVSLELPTLPQAHIPRRAISLPRITEYSKTSLNTRFISHRVAESHLHGTAIVRRLSTGRRSKVAVATPFRIARSRTQLHTSTMASTASNQHVLRHWDSFMAEGPPAASYNPSPFSPPPLPPLPPQPSGAKEHGLWCRFKTWMKKPGGPK